MSDANKFLNQFIPLIAKNLMQYRQRKKLREMYLQNRMKEYDYYDEVAKEREKRGAQLDKQSAVRQAMVDFVKKWGADEPYPVQAVSSKLGPMAPSIVDELPEVSGTYKEDSMGAKEAAQRMLINLMANKDFSEDDLGSAFEGYRFDDIYDMVKESVSGKEKAIDQKRRASEIKQKQATTALELKKLQQQKAEFREKSKDKEKEESITKFEGFEDRLDAIDKKIEALNDKAQNKIKLIGGTTSDKAAEQIWKDRMSVFVQLDALYDRKAALTEKMIEHRAVDDQKVRRFLTELEQVGTPPANLLNVFPEDIVERFPGYGFTIEEAKAIQTVINNAYQKRKLEQMRRDSEEAYRTEYVTRKK